MISDYCAGTEKVRRWTESGPRVVCSECHADVTDPDDYAAERTGGRLRVHRYSEVGR